MSEQSLIDELGILPDTKNFQENVQNNSPSLSISSLTAIGKDAGPGAIVASLAGLAPAVFMIVAATHKAWACKSGKPTDLQKWLLGYGCMLTILFGSAALGFTGLYIGGQVGTAVALPFVTIFALAAVFGLFIFNIIWTVIGIVEISTADKDECSDVVYNTSVAAVVFGCLVSLAFIGGIGYAAVI